MITAKIVMTGSKCPRKEKYSIFADDKLHAHSMKEMRQALAERYGKSWKHRKPMYQDRKDGKTVRVGYVVGYRNADYSHAPVEWWYQQDWISFSECQPIILKGA